jgi:hypothetical protein
MTTKTPEKKTDVVTLKALCIELKIDPYEARRRKRLQDDQQVIDEARQLARHGSPVGEKDSIPVVRLPAVSRCLMKEADTATGVPGITQFARSFRPEIGNA